MIFLLDIFPPLRFHIDISLNSSFFSRPNYRDQELEDRALIFRFFVCLFLLVCAVALCRVVYLFILTASYVSRLFIVFRVLALEFTFVVDL